MENEVGVRGIGVGKVYALAVPYGVALGVCYGLGYWGLFGVNILEYASLMDVGKMSVQSLVVFIASCFVGWVLPELFNPWFDKRRPPGVYEGGVGERYWGVIIIGVIVVVSIVFGYAPDRYRWWVVVGGLLLSTVVLDAAKEVRRLLPFGGWRKRVLMLVFAVPMACFAFGRFEAYRVVESCEHRVSEIHPPELLPGIDLTQPVLCLGYVGGVYFLFEVENKRLVVLRSQDGLVLFHAVNDVK